MLREREKRQEERAAEDAKCTRCGEGNNCCGLGGSWAGQCPGLHSYGEGHDTCLEIMEISGKSSQHNGDDDAASAQEAPAKEAAVAAPAAEPEPAAPAPAEPAPIAAEPGPMPDDAAQSCKSIRDDATDEWCAQTCKHLTPLASARRFRRALLAAPKRTRDSGGRRVSKSYSLLSLLNYNTKGG